MFHVWAWEHLSFEATLLLKLWRVGPHLKKFVEPHVSCLDFLTRGSQAGELKVACARRRGLFPAGWSESECKFCCVESLSLVALPVSSCGLCSDFFHAARG